MHFKVETVKKIKDGSWILKEMRLNKNMRSFFAAYDAYQEWKASNLDIYAKMGGNYGR